MPGNEEREEIRRLTKRQKSRIKTGRQGEETILALIEAATTKEDLAPIIKNLAVQQSTEAKRQKRKQRKVLEITPRRAVVGMKGRNLDFR